MQQSYRTAPCCPYISALVILSIPDHISVELMDATKYNPEPSKTTPATKTVNQNNPDQRASGELETIEIQTGLDPEATIIWLHGLGGGWA